MGQFTDDKHKNAIALAKSEQGVQTRLTQKRLQEINTKYIADVDKANKDKYEEEAYIARRDNHLLDRKIWKNKDQISLYDITYCGGRFKAAVYYEKDSDESLREQQFQHMIDMEFETLETATMVFKALCDSLNIMMSPVTENHILGKPFKIVTI